jgi:hypothetical protein
MNVFVLYRDMRTYGERERSTKRPAPWGSSSSGSAREDKAAGPVENGSSWFP